VPAAPALLAEAADAADGAPHDDKVPGILREAWDSWAAVDYAAALREPLHATLTMKEPPRWFRGSLVRAYGVALDEWMRSKSTASWALLLFTPRLLLAPTSNKGEEGKAELTKRMERFLRGEWPELLEETALASAPRNPRRHAEDEDQAQAEERKLETACQKVRQGEVSRAREHLTTSGLAPGKADTLAELTDPARRPRVLSQAIPEHVLNHAPAAAFALNRDQLFSCLSTARKGRAADLFGTRLEHLRVLLDSGTNWEHFVRMAEAFSKGETPQEVVELMKLGRMTAPKKRDGRARGIVIGCAFRRLVGKTMARQCAGLFQRATAPYQFALQTRAGMDACSLAPWALTDADPDLVVMSLDGVGAYDHVRRAAFLQALQEDPELACLLPLIRQFYTTPSTYLWVDDQGMIHEIYQGEGGEQGDPLMPALYSLGQHGALRHAASQLLSGEYVFAYLDD